MFVDPLTEVYLLFYQYALQQIVVFRLFLQREEPMVYLIEVGMESILRMLLVKFCTVKSIKESASLLDVDFADADNLLDVENVQIGFTTKQKLRKLENDVDISTKQKQTFLHAACGFYVECAKYVIKTFRFNDLLLMHSRFINFEKRLEASFHRI